MKQRKTNPRMEISANVIYSRNEDERVDRALHLLRELEEHLNEHQMLRGYTAHVTWDYAYACEGCGREYREGNHASECAGCGAEICDWCAYLSEDDERKLCEKCFRAEQAKVLA